MVSSGMLQSASAYAELARELAKRRSGMHDKIADILTRWLDHEYTISLTRCLLAVLQGLSVEARDGATREELEKIVFQAVAGIRAIEPHLCSR
jgi:phosphoserine phosphatase